jgi:hypothetical protein
LAVGEQAVVTDRRQRRWERAAVKSAAGRVTPKAEYSDCGRRDCWDRSDP